MCSQGFINLLNLAGNDISNKLNYQELLNHVMAWHTSDEGKKLIELNTYGLPTLRGYIDDPRYIGSRDNSIKRYNEALSMAKMLTDKSKQLMYYMYNYEEYLFEGTNIIPIKCPVQKSRPVCVFWSILRSLHPEKTDEESMCVLNNELKKSGLNNPVVSRVINQDEKLDLLLLHIFEEFINTDLNTRSFEDYRKNRWSLGGRRQTRRKRSRKSKLYA